MPSEIGLLLFNFALHFQNDSMEYSSVGLINVSPAERVDKS